MLVVVLLGVLVDLLVGILFVSVCGMLFVVLLVIGMLLLKFMVCCVSSVVLMFVVGFLSVGRLLSVFRLRLLRNCLVVVYSVGCFGML